MTDTERQVINNAIQEILKRLSKIEKRLDEIDAQSKPIGGNIYDTNFISKIRKK